MRCGGCGAPADPDDNYCRRCGSALNGRGLSTIFSRSLLPVPWEMARGPVMRGVAALLVGTMAEVVRRGVATRQASKVDPGDVLALLPSSKPSNEKNGRFPWSKGPKGEYEITETVIQRRVRWFKR